MSNRDLCISMLDDFTDAQLINVAAMLQRLNRRLPMLYMVTRPTLRRLPLCRK